MSPGKQVLREITPADADAGVRRPHRVPRGLRPAARALAGLRRRRLAQQSDRAARGERHLRHQGGHQRAPEPEHSRWLVGGRLDAGQRLGHPAGRCRRTPSGAMRSRPSSSSMRSRRRWCRSITPRDERGLPRDWVRRCKRAMMTVIPRFNMRRVLFDYTQGLYQPGRRRTTSACPRAASPAPGRWRTGSSACAQAWPRVSLRLLSDARA